MGLPPMLPPLRLSAYDIAAVLAELGYGTKAVRRVLREWKPEVRLTYRAVRDHLDSERENPPSREAQGVAEGDKRCA